MTVTVQITPVTDHADLPAHLRADAAPGRWVHITGSDAAGQNIEYWGAADLGGDGLDEGSAAFIGARILEAAFGDEEG